MKSFKADFWSYGPEKTFGYVLEGLKFWKQLHSDKVDKWNVRTWAVYSICIIFYWGQITTEN